MSLMFGHALRSPCTCPTNVGYTLIARNVSLNGLPPFVASEHVKIALRAANAEDGKQTGWYAEGNVGVYQFGSLPTEGYQPLYQMQRIQLRNKQPRRDGRPPGEKL